MATGTDPQAPARTRGVHEPSRAAIRERHLRGDRWWLAPAATTAGLLAFVVYSTWRAFADADYYAAPYVSPFYSPCLAEHCEPMRAGPNWEIVGNWWGLSPALLILIFPLGFRLTCYYYRKAYYRGFWSSPPACAVPEPRSRYTGETRFPLILQNSHRYFFYAAVLVAGILTYDTVLAFRDEHYDWGHMGLGTVVFLVNIVLIWAYTLSCHSCRHIIGGRLKHFSRHPVRYRMWGWVSGLNARHAQLAWASLVSVALADLYVYLVASGAFDDPRFF
ncbi:hypothetical protein [Streptomyces sp. SAJ15]|uniref:hypothetical protein n=1 Tax=Streptomyces sp. SAJ15 TaxID=2011095 RepID=UPI0011857FE1|nr:hypothetical protein [Streptomyces sp. SAJ15]TVL93946.1 hypothetical protein CD790_02705 [Streptomyces sp. SAJ15]